ncbi:hypothetical protein SAMN06265338_101583 [Rhodoblastus acidophilus]|uniref:Uncharacterized protein n=1 Tax=Rhodoblastus acidophilus TaxID=1074 RepID=A0A212QHX9_RHOAC|nr:hypothetical protein [Rhodoblastus acidophilus]SNB58905.1 hypothetical protein SAMN06265338_101583 [Rhodoblastus acidophilus]
METSILIALSLAHIVLGASVAYLNITAANDRLRAAARRDGAQLRVALRAEMASLLEFCTNNLTRLAGGRNVLSSRASVFIYRGNVARLITMEPHEIAVIVAAYSRIDYLDHVLAASMTPVGVMIYKPPAGAFATEEIEEAMNVARRALQDAIATLDRADAERREEAPRFRLLRQAKKLAPR